MKLLSRVQLLKTPWTLAWQTPLSMGFSRQEYWSGLPFPSPGDLPDPGIEPRSPPLEADALTSEPPGKPRISIDAWIYLWAFCFVPLIYISVFVPVPYCLDDCGFRLILPGSFFFLKFALAIRGFLYFYGFFLFFSIFNFLNLLLFFLHIFLCLLFLLLFSPCS